MCCSVHLQKESLKNIKLITYADQLCNGYFRQTDAGPDPCPEGNGMDYEARARNQRRQMSRAGAQHGQTRGAARKRANGLTFVPTLALTCPPTGQAAEARGSAALASLRGSPAHLADA